MKQTPIEVKYRHIAKMLVKAMPLDGDDFRDKVNEYIEVIKKLPAESKTALKCAYIWSEKVPREEREDMYQELVLAVLKAKSTDERLSYSICRCDWQNWWEKFKTRQQYYAGSLNKAIEDDQGGVVEFGELLVGDCDFDRRMNGKIDGQALYDRLPSWVQYLVNRRLTGFGLTKLERESLDRWVSHRPTILASYLT